MARSGPAQQVLQLIVFEVGADELALDAAAVDQIQTLDCLQRGATVGGQIGRAVCAGETVAVVSLRARLGQPPGRSTEDSRIIFISAADRGLGLVVDRVGAVLRVDRAVLGPARDHRGPAWRGCLAGSVDLHDRTLPVLDAGALIADCAADLANGARSAA